MISTRQIGLVAMRDFWAIVQTKSFLIGLAAFFFIASVMPGMLALSQFKAEYRIALIDPVGGYREELERRLAGDKQFEFVALAPESDRETQRTTALQQVRAKKFFALVEIIPAGTQGAEESFTLSAANLADPTPRQRIEGVLSDLVRERRATRLGISNDTLNRLLAPPQFQALRITATGKTENAQDRDFIFAYVLPIGMVFSLYGLISFQSERLLTALLEEKLKRLLEVLLTRVTIYELLLGKMLGILYVGFILYCGVGLLATCVEVALGVAHLLSFRSVFFFTLFYISGYSLYATFYAAIGAACGNPKDAENLSMPLRMLLTLPIFISVYVNTHPSSAGSLFFSYFPLTAPFVMTNRMLVSSVSAWEIALALTSVLAAGVLGLWAATRIFRASLLAQTRSLGIRDIWKSLIDHD